MPGESIGTRNALTPRPRMPGCVAAKTIATSAASALATQTLRPLMHVAALVEPRDGLLVGGVGSGLLLREREGADRLARRQPPQPASASARRVPNCAIGSATSELFTLAITATTALARATASSASA